MRNRRPLPSSNVSPTVQFGTAVRKLAGSWTSLCSSTRKNLNTPRRYRGVEMADGDTSAEARLSQTAPWRRLSFVAEVRRVTRAGRLAAVDARSAGASGTPGSRLVQISREGADGSCTHVNGFACRCLTPRPPRQSRSKINGTPEGLTAGRRAASLTGPHGRAWCPRYGRRRSRAHRSQASLSTSTDLRGARLSHRSDAVRLCRPRARSSVGPFVRAALPERAVAPK